MRKLLITAFVAAMAFSAQAVPALKKWRTYQQTDGTQVTLLLSGDENLHYFKTTDGLVVLQDENENYVYAQLTNDGFEPTQLLAHNADMRSADEQAQIAKLGDVANTGLRRAAAQKPRFAHTIGEPTGNFVGSKKGLVIMVEFSDVSFTVTIGEQEDGRVVGVGGLHFIWDKLAEVRTMAVAEGYTRRGVGAEIVRRLLQQRQERQLQPRGGIRQRVGAGRCRQYRLRPLRLGR